MPCCSYHVSDANGGWKGDGDSTVVVRQPLDLPPSPTQRKTQPDALRLQPTRRTRSPRLASPRLASQHTLDDTNSFSSHANRTIGAYPDVAVVNGTTAGGHASLLADVYCGEGTKLVYYLGPGEVISRTFTSKDTHCTRGDLLVPFTEAERLDEFHLKRTQATTSLLGFGSPSFS